MKHRGKIFTLLFIAIITQQSYGQIRWDIFGGGSPAINKVSTGIIVNRQNPHEEFRFNVDKMDAQYFIGTKANAQLSGPFFAELGMVYTKRKHTYQVAYTVTDTDRTVSRSMLKESTHTVMLPMNIGVSMGALEITSGFRAMKNFGSKSELTELSGFSSESNPIHFGWQGGTGYFIGNTRIGVEYQGNFSRVGNGKFINGQSLELPNIPGQFVFTLQQSIR